MSDTFIIINSNLFGDSIFPKVMRDRVLALQSHFGFLFDFWKSCILATKFQVFTNLSSKLSYFVSPDSPECMKYFHKILILSFLQMKSTIFHQFEEVPKSKQLPLYFYLIFLAEVDFLNYYLFQFFQILYLKWPFFQFNLFAMDYHSKIDHVKTGVFHRINLIHVYLEHSNSSN